jgi:hypothetical protein
MAQNTKSFGTILIVVLLVLLLYALNPTSEDFQAWRSAQAREQATSGDTGGLVGAMKKGSGAIAGAMTGIAAGGYRRKDYLVCSSYSLGSDSYLGVARLFIRLK